MTILLTGDILLGEIMLAIFAGDISSVHRVGSEGSVVHHAPGGRDLSPEGTAGGKHSAGGAHGGGSAKTRTSEKERTGASRGTKGSTQPARSSNTTAGSKHESNR